MENKSFDSFWCGYIRYLYTWKQEIQTFGWYTPMTAGKQIEKSRAEPQRGRYIREKGAEIRQNAFIIACSGNLISWRCTTRDVSASASRTYHLLQISQTNLWVFWNMHCKKSETTETPNQETTLLSLLETRLHIKQNYYTAHDNLPTSTTNNTRNNVPTAVQSASWLTTCPPLPSLSLACFSSPVSQECLEGSSPVEAFACVARCRSRPAPLPRSPM